MVKQKPEFDGETYDQDRDGPRLFAQLSTIGFLMRDGKWRSLHEISCATGYPESSISARLRDLRKEKFGSHVVAREYVSHGLWRYRIEK